MSFWHKSSDLKLRRPPFGEKSVRAVSSGVFFTALASCCFSVVHAERPSAIHLRTEFVVDPLAVGTNKPRLSWWGEEVRRGARQTSYQIELWDLDHLDKSRTDPLWRSGRVRSPMQIASPPTELLHGRTQYAWRIRLWDELGTPGPWSAKAQFGTGMLDRKDWRDARWIAFHDDNRWRSEWNERKSQEFTRYKANGLTPVLTSDHMTSWQLLDSVTPRYDPSPLLRKQFTVSAPIRSARLYVSGVGYAVEWFNGRRLGTAVLDPGWTNYQHDVLYRTFDVTHAIQEGRNVIGVMLGRGFYGMLSNDRWGFAANAPWINQPAVKALLEVKYQDGRIAEVTTDDSWKVARGPILYDDPWLGEVYDAREEHLGWADTNYDDDAWGSAQIVQGPSGSLRPQLMPPVRPVGIVNAVSMKKISPAVWMIDLGVDIAGWMRLTVRGNAGDKVLVQMAEKPDPQTFIDTTTGNFQQFGYVLKGGGDETAESHFSYMGFRYARITLTPASGAIPRIKTAVGVYVHTDVTRTGIWNSSNPLLNHIDTIWRRTQLNNMNSIPTDCPHREKLGWMADAFIAQPAVLYSFDAAAFYENYSEDVSATQNEKGLLSTIAPSFGYTAGESPLWASADVWIPWRLYLYNGDREALRRRFPGIKRFLDATLVNNAIAGQPYIMRDVLGDWDSPGHENPPEGNEPYSTAYYFLDCQLGARMARLLGDDSSASELEQRANHVEAAFNQQFYSPDFHIYHGSKATEYRQSLNALALWAGLVPEVNRVAVYRNLREDVLARDSHLNTGIIGTKPLMEVLADQGDVDLAYRVVTQRTYPSWGYMLSKGATTMWESWNGRDSHDHPMQGTVVEFFYRYLAGIRVDETHPGFDQFFIEPIFPEGLNQAGAHYQSERGLIISEWTRNRDKIWLHLRVPFNTTAKVVLPSIAIGTCSVVERSNTLRTSSLWRQDREPDHNAEIHFDLDPGDHQLQFFCR